MARTQNKLSHMGAGHRTYHTIIANYTRDAQYNHKALILNVKVSGQENLSTYYTVEGRKDGVLFYHVLTAYDIAVDKYNGVELA